MFNNKGFTLIEALVAMVIGVAIVVGLGGLGERLIHHRVTTDSNSAAMSLAERQLEALLADSNPNPTGGECPAALLCGAAPPAGLTKGPTNVDINLNASAAGPYRVQWNVVDSTTTPTSPFVVAVTGGTPPTAVKKITVTVTHVNNPSVNATVVRYYKVS